MARQGRRQKQSTHYQSAWRTVPSNQLAGVATITITATPSAEALVVSGASLLSTSVGQNRFRHTLVPPLTNLAEVQAHLQRSIDEVARAVNPLRSVADGGTGLAAVTAGAILAGTDDASMETVPPGEAFSVLMSDGSMPTYSSAPPVWRRFAVAYTDLAAAATTGTAIIYELPAREIVHAAVIKHSASFTGGAIASYTLSVGIAGSATKYTPALNVFAAPSDTGFAQSPTGLTSVENMGASTNIIVTATSTGANLNAATAGAAEVLLLIATLPTT